MYRQGQWVKCVYMSSTHNTRLLGFTGRVRKQDTTGQYGGGYLVRNDVAQEYWFNEHELESIETPIKEPKMTTTTTTTAATINTTDLRSAAKARLTAALQGRSPRDLNGYEADTMYQLTGLRRAMGMGSSALKVVMSNIMEDKPLGYGLSFSSAKPVTTPTPTPKPAATTAPAPKPAPPAEPQLTPQPKPEPKPATVPTAKPLVEAVLDLLKAATNAVEISKHDLSEADVTRLDEQVEKLIDACVKRTAKAPAPKADPKPVVKPAPTPEQKPTPPATKVEPKPVKPQPKSKVDEVPSQGEFDQRKGRKPSPQFKVGARVDLVNTCKEGEGHVPSRPGTVKEAWLQLADGVEYVRVVHDRAVHGQTEALYSENEVELLS
jgi:hypothetical protein